MVDLLVLTSLDQLLFKLEILFTFLTKQAYQKLLQNVTNFFYILQLKENDLAYCELVNIFTLVFDNIKVNAVALTMLWLYLKWNSDFIYTHFQCLSVLVSACQCLSCILLLCMAVHLHPTTLPLMLCCYLQYQQVA